jgi:glycosyltransferase involved in cell wall biosynthesis
MRVLIFTPAYLPFVGGAEIAVKEITDRMPETEFVVVTARLSPDVPREERVGNATVHRIGAGKRTDVYRFATEGVKTAETLGAFDAVWSVMASYGGFAASRYKKRHPNVPFLLTLQEGDSRFHIYKHIWWCWPAFVRIFRRADHIQAISAYLAEWAKRLGAVCPVSVVPNGVDIARFAGRTEPPNSEASVLTVSRLVQKNGIDALIAALQLLPADIHLSIAGSGPLEHHLKQLAHRRGLDARVHFLGTVDHAHLPALLASARVFCRPSRSEGLGNAFLESMAAGTPIVGTRVGGIPDFLKDGETGLFCRVGDPADIAANISRLLADDALRARIVANAKRLVEAGYSWDSIAERMRRIFASFV